MTKYKFIGKNSLGLEHGNIYTLHIVEPKLFTRLMLLKPSWKVIIIYPFECPYTSWDKFHENWERVEKHPKKARTGSIGLTRANAILSYTHS